VQQPEVGLADNLDQIHVSNTGLCPSRGILNALGIYKQLSLGRFIGPVAAILVFIHQVPEKQADKEH